MFKNNFQIFKIIFIIYFFCAAHPVALLNAIARPLGGLDP